MGDVYRMPAPRPPDDVSLDHLDAKAANVLLFTGLGDDTRQVIRAQRDAIRNLRIALAKTEASLLSAKAIAAMRRDVQVADGPPQGPTV